MALEFTRDGTDAEFLWIEDSGSGKRPRLVRFQRRLWLLRREGAEAGRDSLCPFLGSSCSGGRSAASLSSRPVFGAGRVFYLGSGEMWRLRSVNEAYFERFYTKLDAFRFARAIVARIESWRVAGRARSLPAGQYRRRACPMNGAQLEPLVAPQVTLQVYLPDTTQQNVTLLADPSRPGNFAGQFTVRKEGVYRLELPVPEVAEERLTRRIQVKVPDLEREKPQRNDALLNEIATKTGGSYYVGLQAALGSGDRGGTLGQANCAIKAG